MNQSNEATSGRTGDEAQQRNRRAANDPEQTALDADELVDRFGREPGSGDTDEHLPAQEPEGAAMGSVRGSRRLDPITGKPLYEADDEAQVAGVGAGDAYRNPAEKGIGETSKRPATGTPSSTPRREKGIRDF